MKKIMTLVIGVSLLFPSGALFAQARKGVQLEITKTDGTKINGELIAVKQDSTLLLESSSGIGASINMSDIKVIKIVKGSNTGTGVLLGLLAGGATGAIIGDRIGNPPGQPKILEFFTEKTTKPLGIILGGALGGLAGGLLGGAIGSSIHNYEPILIEGKSPEEIKKVLEKLRTQARFPEYQ
jgi:outer membrane lipoprotein SlyB